MFDVIFVMTRGGPGSATELISIFFQRVGFREAIPAPKVQGNLFMLFMGVGGTEEWNEDR